jgi:hypothetical protein
LGHCRSASLSEPRYAKCCWRIPCQAARASHFLDLPQGAVTQFRHTRNRRGAGTDSGRQPTIRFDGWLLDTGRARMSCALRRPQSEQLFRIAFVARQSTVGSGQPCLIKVTRRATFAPIVVCVVVVIVKSGTNDRRAAWAPVARHLVAEGGAQRLGVARETSLMCLSRR